MKRFVFLCFIFLYFLLLPLSYINSWNNSSSSSNAEVIILPPDVSSRDETLRPTTIKANDTLTPITSPNPTPDPVFPYNNGSNKPSFFSAHVETIILVFGEIFSAIIGALIAGGYINRVVRKEISPHLFVYSDESHNAHKIMRKAKKRIYIIASIGDIFMNKHASDLANYLKKGVEINYLIHTEEKNIELEDYLNPSIVQEKIIKNREETISKLRELKQLYPNNLNVRVTDLVLTASYIGVDIDEEQVDYDSKLYPAIQSTLYQFRQAPGESPAMYFTPNSYARQYNSAKKCILSIWNSSDEYKNLVPESSERSSPIFRADALSKLEQLQNDGTISSEQFDKIKSELLC